MMRCQKLLHYRLLFIGHSFCVVMQSSDTYIDEENKRLGANSLLVFGYAKENTSPSRQA